MKTDFLSDYKTIRNQGLGFYEQKRGLIAVWGREAVQFLNGMITNDAAKLEEGAVMQAAFPNAQGRLLAVVRVMRKEDKFLFVTEDATREKIFQNLFRFTFAGDFFVEDLSENNRCFTLFGNREISGFEDRLTIPGPGSSADHLLPKESAEEFLGYLKQIGAVEIADELYEVLRIESGIPLYGVDMDETTIVPEIDMGGLISYTKGCYVGQEIIARIHFRGHVAKKLTGLIFDDENAEIDRNDEIKSLEGKNSGRVTSATFSPALEKKIALAFVRYDFLAEGTQFKVGDATAKVKNLPFVE